MHFSSDNWAGAHPRIAESLTRHAAGFEPAYGGGDLDAAVTRRFCEIFEREVAVFFVGTGTAANALSLTLHARPGGIAFCHRGAHIMEDECGAPEYLSGGGRLRAVDGPFGKFSADALERSVARFFPQIVHDGRACAISITQATEAGTVYSLDEIEGISAVAGKFALPLHMDGARFANALVSLDTTPAEMTWKRGVDMVSFGGTKNGCWCAEAIVLFDTSKADELAFIRKRAAQLFSKSRFIAAQFDAYFADDLWLETARHANATAAALADVLRTAPLTRLAWEPQANEVFGIMRRDTMDRALAAGARFYEWHVPADFAEPIAPDEVLCRFVTSFATSRGEIDTFARLVGN
ncbi:MAG: low specificity L-threonine aldolase [Rhizobiaceae bacterium]|nr:low specificity L-threonine aldolase [Rhizobiaceae bacterium]